MELRCRIDHVMGTVRWWDLFNVNRSSQETGQLSQRRWSRLASFERQSRVSRLIWKGSFSLREAKRRFRDRLDFSKFSIRIIPVGLRHPYSELTSPAWVQALRRVNVVNQLFEESPPPHGCSNDNAVFVSSWLFSGETVYAAPAKKNSTTGGTLNRRNRRGHASALSSSSTASSDRSETVFPDEHSRMHLNNGKSLLKGFLSICFFLFINIIYNRSSRLERSDTLQSRCFEIRIKLVIMVEGLIDFGLRLISLTITR